MDETGAYYTEWSKPERNSTAFIKIWLVNSTHTEVEELSIPIWRADCQRISGHILKSTSTVISLISSSRKAKIFMAENWPEVANDQGWEKAIDC